MNTATARDFGPHGGGGPSARGEWVQNCELWSTLHFDPLGALRKMFFWMGNWSHLGEILGLENVNFGPLFILTPLRGPTPDLTRESYSPGGPR